MKSIMLFTALLTVLVQVGSIPAALADSQNYNVRGASARPGMLVSLTANQDLAEPTNPDNADLLIGIVADEQNASGQTNVVTNGTKTEALVSTLHGSIKVGDRIGASSLEGIGAKIQSNGWAVGIAQASFSAESTGAVSTTLTDVSGKEHTVWLGRIPVVVQILHLNAAGVTKEKSRIPAGLQALADTVAGKSASPTAIILSFTILLIGLVVVGLMVNSIIRNSFLAISRQPLIRTYLTATVWQSFSIVLLILLTVLVAAVIVLRVF